MAGVAPSGTRRSASASIDSVPQMPQLDVVVPRRGVGVGARPPVSTVTTLNCGLDSGTVRAVAHAGDAGAGQQALGEAEPDGQLVVVARRAHRRVDHRAVELDRHRLLDDQLVGSAARCPVGDRRDEQRLAAPPRRTRCHASNVAAGPLESARPGAVSSAAMSTQDNGRIFAAETVGTAVLDARRPGHGDHRRHCGGQHRGHRPRVRPVVADHGVPRRADLRLPPEPGGDAGDVRARARSTGRTPCSPCSARSSAASAGRRSSTGSPAVSPATTRGQFAANLWTAPGKYFGLGSTIVVEVVFTALLVMVVPVRHRRAASLRPSAASSPGSP